MNKNVDDSQLTGAIDANWADEQELFQLEMAASGIRKAARAVRALIVEEPGQPDADIRTDNEIAQSVLATAQWLDHRADNLVKFLPGECAVGPV